MGGPYRVSSVRSHQPHRLVVGERRVRRIHPGITLTATMAHITTLQLLCPLVLKWSPSLPSLVRDSIPHQTKLCWTAASLMSLHGIGQVDSCLMQHSKAMEQHTHRTHVAADTQVACSTRCDFTHP